MASFTDQLPQFTPYQPEQNLDLMMKVGTFKQQKYDEGVQKIQNYIDEKIAGLDIAKPEYRKHAQSLMNELGNNLRYVAGGDFSNQQLVSSVGNMASQIIKDPTIQRAVSDTKAIRKGQADMDVAIKAGKSSINNEAYWNKSVSDYLTNPDTKTPFNSRFYDHIDYNKKLVEAAEKIHEIDNTVEIPYIRDDAGNPLYFDEKGNATTPDKGVKKIDDVMLKITTKGKPAQKILDMFYNTLDDNDRNQMKIDSWAKYRGTTKETLMKDTVTGFTNTRKMLSQQAVSLATDLKDPKLTTVQSAQIKARLDDINTKLSNGSLEKEENDQLMGLQNIKDIEQYKYEVFTKNHLNALAQDLSYQSYTQEIKDNPYMQMYMSKLKLEKDVEAAKQAHDDRTEALVWDKYKWTTEQRQKLEGVGTPVWKPDGLPSNMAAPTLNTVDAKISAGVAELNQLNIDFVGHVLNDADHKGWTNAQKVSYMDELSKKYAVNPGSVTTNDADLKSYLKQRRTIEIANILDSELKKTVKTGSDAIYGKEIDKVIGGEIGLIDRNKRTLFTALDLYDVVDEYTNSRLANVKSEGGGFMSSISNIGNLANPMSGTVGTGSTQDDFNAKAFLKQFKGTNKEAIAVALSKEHAGQPLTQVESAIVDRAKKIHRQYREPIGNVRQQQLAYESAELQKRMPEAQTKTAALSKENKFDMDKVEGAIAAATKFYNTYGALNNEHPEQYDPVTLNKWRSDPTISKTLETLITKNYDGSGTLTFQNGLETQIIPLTASEFRANFARYAKGNPIDNIKETIMKSNNGTTNFTGSKTDTGAVNAYLSGSDIPKIAGTSYEGKVRMDVEGSFQNTGGEGGRYQLRIYIQQPSGLWISENYPLNGDYASEQGITEMIGEVSPTTIDDITKRKK